jgi:hypothetical protein
MKLEIIMQSEEIVVDNCHNAGYGIYMRKDNYIEDVLMAELKKAKESTSSIARQSGVERSVLCRFLHDERGLSVSAAAQLLRYFGYEIKKSKRAKA